VPFLWLYVPPTRAGKLQSYNHPSDEIAGQRLLMYRARRVKAAMGTKLVKTLHEESVQMWKKAFGSASK
jgi:hypothetical protein